MSCIPQVAIVKDWTVQIHVLVWFSDPSAGWPIYPLSTLVAGVPHARVKLFLLLCHSSTTYHCMCGWGCKVTWLNLGRGAVLQWLKLFLYLQGERFRVHRSSTAPTIFIEWQRWSIWRNFSAWSLPVCCFL